MTPDMALTPDQVAKAAETIKKLRPVYASLLNFYEQVFVAQEDAKSRIQMDPIQISEAILAVKAEEKLPLINMSEFKIDSKSAGELLKKICTIAKDANENMANSAQALLAAIDSEYFDLDLLFSSLIEENDAFFVETAEDRNIDKNILAFLTYSSIQPSLTLCAEQLATYLHADDPWEKGYCPICGSPPGLSLLEEEGARFLTCSFCWHRWSARRVYCPFCENTDSKTLHYFFSEEEEDYRVDVCDGCNKYIKVIDTRKANRVIYPPLEQISTLHLDIQAREKGLESGGHLSLQA